jgi:hypothetical protein
MAEIKMARTKSTSSKTAMPKNAPPKTYSVNPKSGEMNKAGKTYIKKNGPAPGSQVPKKDKTVLSSS